MAEREIQLMIRVAHILWDAQLGGIQKVVLDLCRAQAASGEVQPIVIFARPLGPLFQSFAEAGAEVHTLDIRSGYDVKPGNYLRLYRQLKDAHLVHLHSYNPFISAAASMSGRPIVYTEHGNFGFGRKLRITERVNQFLQRRFLNRSADWITFNSLFSQRIARERYGLKRPTCRVIYNGVDLDAVREGAAGIPAGREGTFTIGTTTRLAGGKRVLLLLHAFREFIQRHPARLLILGDGPEREMLESYCVDNHIEDRVTFAGAVTNPASMQANMHLCVYPFYHEAFGLVAVETLALGKPALVMEDGGGLTEIISGISPLDVCPDETAMLRRMEYWYENPAEREAFAPKARTHAERFGIREMHQAMLNVYQEALGN
ncbi:MAG: glycosyltransferase family 4 protein [Bacteroidales bacterium]|nr:glycosyltransferase family 4 protein [Bacteroidales bacterium]